MREPKAPYDCDHRHRLFISATRGTPMGDDNIIPDRSHVTLCADCGQFTVFAEKSGKAVEVRFLLATQELVEAAGQWHRLLEAEDD